MAEVISLQEYRARQTNEAKAVNRKLVEWMRHYDEARRAFIAQK